MTRRFAVISSFEGTGITLPQRKTRLSAGYDIEAAEDVELGPGRVTLVPTGLKAYMEPDEVLLLFIRSGFSLRNAVTMINSIGVIDADYADNPDNEGHIQIPLFNQGQNPVLIRRGERLVQGVFVRYLRTEEDGPGEARAGGFGSTGR